MAVNRDANLQRSLWFDAGIIMGRASKDVDPSSTSKYIQAFSGIPTARLCEYVCEDHKMFVDMFVKI